MSSGRRKKETGPNAPLRGRERGIGILVLLFVWQAGAAALNQKLLLPTPLAAASCFFRLLPEVSFWKTIGCSFLRIETGFFLALFLGAASAALSAAFRPAQALLWPVFALAKTVPVASIIVLCLIWLNAENLSVFISALMVLPVVYFNLLQGIKETDPQLLEAAKIFRMRWPGRLFYIYLPQIRPFLCSACATGLGIAWKAGIAAEIIGIPDGSIGERIYEAKIYLNTAELFAWTAVVVCVSAVFEKFFMAVLGGLFNRLERR